LKKFHKNNSAIKKKYMFFLIMFLISAVSLSQDKKIYDEGYIVKVGDKATDFTIKEAGVT